MSEDQQVQPPDSKENPEMSPANSKQRKSVVTRRDFLVRSNASAAAAGIMTGAGFAATTGGATQAPPARAAAAPAPMKVRSVTLDIDGVKHAVTVDVRESLWETMNYQLGLSNVNLGCDRAQCGACTVLVDGRPVNGCTLLTARLGRGQKILTVAGLSKGRGSRGLHPVQRAFWLEGGFQCGICTRGFVMSTYALLQNHPNPTNAEIKEALAGNICRCGEYAKILTSVQKAAAELRGERVRYSASLATIEEGLEESEAPVENAVTMRFEYESALATIEDFDDLALDLEGVPGIVRVSGSERTITIVWDPARLDEARVRQLLAERGHPARP